MPNTQLPKTQRIRDPIHDLIVFDKDDPFDQLIWRLLNSKEFQRLRRIRQLGFSEFVFPGATHTRFAHSVGVFHTARQLMATLKKLIKPDGFEENKANTAICAALLHDIGHGPFSHTFEGMQKQRGFKKSHEAWTVEIIRGDTEVNEILGDYDKKNKTNLIKGVGDLLLAKDPTHIYASIVSSQLDADRMDYLQRDQYMTGTGTGRFDYTWLLDSIAVEKINIGLKGDDDVSEQDGLVLTEKGLQAAEGYILGRFHLYSQVYMHKTTRAAEKMLGALLARTADFLTEGNFKATNLAENQPLALFLNNGHNILNNYLALDDTIIWSALAGMREASDPVIAELSSRLLDRKLFKCIDIGALSGRDGGQSLMKFRRRLQEANYNNEIELGVDTLIDKAKITAYGSHDFDGEAALQKVLIRRYKDDKEPIDIVQQSRILKGIEEQKIFRVYTANNEVLRKIKQIWKGGADHD
jgi:HD superfamily phosphohydrolase